LFPVLARGDKLVRDSGEERYEQGKKLATGGRWHGSIPFFRLAVSLARPDARGKARMALALAYLATNHPDTAEANALRAIEELRDADVERADFAKEILGEARHQLRHKLRVAEREARNRALIEEAPL